MSTDYFYPLYHSVNILIIDDEPYQLDFYESILTVHPLYKIYKALNAKEADTIIKSKRIHLCTLDFGINDLQSDEYYLLKQHGPEIPFVIISGSNDIERAFKASTLGAAALLAKPVLMIDHRYWNSLQTSFLDNTILPLFPSNVNPILKELRSIIQQDLPESVSEWAAKANVTDSYLRKIWGECTSSSPKMLLFLYKMYKSAFEWFNALCIAELNNTSLPVSEPDTCEHRRIIQYYLQNKDELDGIRDEW